MASRKRNLEEQFLLREVCSSTRFRQDVQSSPSFVEGLRLTHVLEQHGGCVNTIEWHPEGHELLSSGDDLELAIWDSSSWQLKGCYRTGHVRNVFCVKYVPHQPQSFITAAMDGDVRLVDLVQQEDRTLVPRVEALYSNPGAMALKIEFLPTSASCFLTTHHDGTIRMTDLRNARNTATAGDAEEHVVVELEDNVFYSLCFDPLNPNQFAATCGNHFVRLYDLRMAGRPYDREGGGRCVKLWTDPALLNGRRPRDVDFSKQSRRHVTDVQFSSAGDLLCNFSGHDVVLLAAEDENMTDQLCTKVIRRFRGRQNVETFLKEVRFLGREEYVCTGSDSGEVFIWETSSGELVHRVPGDKMVVNGVAPHPFLPTLAVCGIDSEVKIFEFRGGGGILEQDPIKAGLDGFSDMLSFHGRRRTFPTVTLGRDVEIRLEGAEELRAEGNELFKAGQVGHAIAVYDRALEHLKYCPPSMQERQARDKVRLLLYLNLSASYLIEKEYRNAEKCANKALQIDPNCVKGLYRRARARIGSSNEDAAMVDLEKALELVQISGSAEDIEAIRKLRDQCAKRLKK